MGQESSPIDQAISRALRDNLATLQRTTNELHQAVADVIASCSSSRPTNSLPPLLRAQAAAASLAASLEVLARFVASSVQLTKRGSETEAFVSAVSLPAPEPAPAPEMPPPGIPTPMAEEAAGGAAVEEVPPPSEPFAEEPPAEIAEPVPAAPAVMERVGTGTVHEERAPIGEDTIYRERGIPVPEVSAEAAPEVAVAEPEPAVAEPEPVVEEAPAFDIRTLTVEEQEMHRRANRVAKVSMQDIKMLKRDAVRQGREHKDLCMRLKDDIEKARKEYERRFRPILDHPVDYFHQWMVEILADGDPEALGEYPYPSPTTKR